MQRGPGKNNRPRIAVNTRLLLKGKLEGIGWFTYETLKRMVISHPEVDFYFIFDRKYDEEFIFASNVHPVRVFPPARHPVLFYLWFEWSIPFILKKIKADLFFSPDQFNSLRAKGKNLLVIHDLNFEHYPDDLPNLVSRYYRYFTPRFARKADHIITVSQASKKDIEQQYHIDNKKISVAYNGANKNYKPLSKKDIQLVREKYSQGQPFFLFIGSLHPRKNLKNLFRAFDLYKKKTNSVEKLIIVGAKKWWTTDIEDAFRELSCQQDVIFTGHLCQEELIRLSASALALTYVSYFEGFGIPIVEAFYSDIPVITSSISSMPEIAGDAALLCDPFSPQGIADAMEKIAKDKELRESLIEKGRKRRKLFSWDLSAAHIWESIETLLQTGK